MRDQFDSDILPIHTAEIASALDVIVYDGDCALCRMLVDFARRVATSGDVRYEDAATFGQRHPHLLSIQHEPELAVLTATGQWLTGHAAWIYAVGRYPGLSRLQWLAAKLGVAEALPQTLRYAGRLARRHCRSCGR